MAKNFRNIIMDCYQALYEAATPSLDFKKYVDECLIYEDEKGNIHVMEKPLVYAERIERGLKVFIDYTKYKLDKKTYESIVEKYKKKHRLNELECRMFECEMYLGCGPSF